LCNSLSRSLYIIHIQLRCQRSGHQEPSHLQRDSKISSELAGVLPIERAIADLQGCVGRLRKEDERCGERDTRGKEKGGIDMVSIQPELNESRIMCSPALRPIMRLSHARSRYIYDLYYKRELISRELYDWLLKQGYADAK
jgi:hypothetical protein